MKAIRLIAFLLFSSCISFVYTGSAFAGFEGNSNTFYGSDAGANTTGDDDSCTFVGRNAGHNNTTGYANTFVGRSAGHNTTTGSDNTFLGFDAGHNNTVGSYNTFIGRYAGYFNTNGIGNTFIGNYAGDANTTGDDNTFIGLYAGYNNTTGRHNTIFGSGAGLWNETGDFNTFLGYRAGYLNTEGNANTFLGVEAGFKNTTGESNTFIGIGAGGQNTVGRNNTILGSGAGNYNGKGNNNTYIGRFAGRNSTGNASVFIGYNAGYNEGQSNRLYIDNSSTSTPLIYGDFGANTLTFNGDVNITGSLTKGSGSFVQPHPTDPKKELVYAFFEGREHAIFFRGKARLVDGKATIETPEDFRVVAGKDEDITVQFTPRYTDTYGLAAVEVTKEKIEVRELKAGTGTYEFDYFITAKRAGFERHEPIQPNTHFTADMKTKDDFEKLYAKTDDVTVSAMRTLLISNGILTREGKLNTETAKKLGWKVKELEVAMNEQSRKR